MSNTQCLWPLSHPWQSCHVSLLCCLLIKPCPPFETQNYPIPLSHTIHVHIPICQVSRHHHWHQLSPILVFLSVDQSMFAIWTQKWSNPYFTNNVHSSHRFMFLDIIIGVDDHPFLFYCRLGPPSERRKWSNPSLFHTHTHSNAQNHIRFFTICMRNLIIS